MSYISILFIYNKFNTFPFLKVTKKYFAKLLKLGITNIRVIKRPKCKNKFWYYILNQTLYQYQ